MSAAIVPFRQAEPPSIEGRAPPHDLDAEAAVLSNVLISPTAFAQCADLLQPDRFFAERHRRIWEAFEALTEAKTPIEIVTVASWLKHRERLAQIGGMGYLTEVLNASPAIANVRHHAMIVHERWRVRVGVLALQRATAIAYGDYGTAQQWLDEVLAKVVTVARLDPNTKQEEHHETASRALDEMARVKAGEAPTTMFGLSTGSPSVDAAMRGLCAGEMILISSTPGGGKTVFGDQVASAVASENNGVLSIVAADMTRDALFDRRMARLASVDHSKITESRKTKAVLDAQEEGRFMRAAIEAAPWPLLVIEKHGISIEEIEAMARRAHDTGLRSGMGDGSRVPLRLIVVDYIQEVKPPAGVTCEKRWQWTEHTAPRLHALALELKIAILCLAQVKTPDARAKRQKPSLGSTAGSAETERKADVIGYLWEPDPKNQRRREMIFVKIRGKKKIELTFDFDGAFARLNEGNDPLLAGSRHYVDKLPEPPPGRFDDEGEYR